MIEADDLTRRNSGTLAVDSLRCTAGPVADRQASVLADIGADLPGGIVSGYGQTSGVGA